MSESVIVYSQPGCPTCHQVKSYLQNRGVEFEERNVAADEKAYEELHERGYAATPLTVIGRHEILGMNRTRFEAVLGRPAEALS
jgi:glutaredoxin